MSIEAQRGQGYTVNSVCLNGARDSRANSVGFLCLFTTRLRLDDAVADRVTHELAHRVEIELRHDLRSMCLCGLGGHAKHRANLLVRPAFGEQLQDFTLARRQAARGGAFAAGFSAI